MAYVDAVMDREREVIVVVERSPDGTRAYKEYPANYVMYFEDRKGKYRSIFGDPLSKFSTRKNAEFQKEKRIHSSKKLFESDINPVFRCLSDNYLGAEPPKLHTCFFDIETNFSKEKGFAPTDDPFNNVTAVTLYLDWMNQLITLVMPPAHMNLDEAQAICDQFENTILFTSEIDMFETFFQLIEDADILTGWNSEGYDIPYMVNRCTRIMSKDDTRKFCLLGQLPKVRKYMKFGKEETTYDLVGRIHMDYLNLYKKYNYENRQSYKLDVIGELEVNEKKVQYEGSLDQLYNKDFKKFIEYNRQDTHLLYKIHAKLEFLELANQLAHENTVLLPTVMGSVAMIEQAIYNEAHARDMIVPDKDRSESEVADTPAAGAYVAEPKKGIHEWIGAVDINSLYPSTIRSLNMAPETIVGQVRQTLTDAYLKKVAADHDAGKKRKKKDNYFESLATNDVSEEGSTGSFLWHGIFASLEYTAIMNQERGTILTVDFEDGRSVEMSAAEIHKMIFDSHKPWVITANATIFTLEKEGVIPGLLSKWYSDRKIMQKKAKTSEDKSVAAYWDKRQLVRKILLNSAYGALLNKHCRYWDKRIGQSVTLSGRTIVKHQLAKINECTTGIYDHLGESIIYGDTDSGYFSVWPMIKDDVESGSLDWNPEKAIELYDTIGDQVNESFPEFMSKSFHTTLKNGEIIKAGRELVADRGLFIVPKRYAVNIIDKEGKRKDKNGSRGEVKAMGLDLKRSDTPKYVQEFLSLILDMILIGKTREDCIEEIKLFKKQFMQKDAWTLGSPKSVNNLTQYRLAEENSKTGSASMPGHVRASLNWNFLRKMNSDKYSMPISDGTRIVVCKLKANPMGFTSIAYPVDELRLPKWFLELPFDKESMMESVVDKKLENLIGVLGWEFIEDTNVNSTFNDLFTFS